MVLVWLMISNEFEMTDRGLDCGGEADLLMNVGLKQAFLSMHELLTQMPENFSTTRRCHHVCYLVLARHIAGTDTKLHATSWPVARAVLRAEVADLV
jgi:hypothetical protein